MQELDKVSKLESFFSSLTTSQKLSDSQIIDCLELLLKLITNIVNNPGEAKYRTIKRSNQTLKNKLFISPVIDTILQTLDFSFVDDSYVFSNPNPFDLINALPVIRNSADEIKDKSLPAEERVKKNELRERQKQLDAKFRKEREEAEKLKKLSQLDRKEKAQEEKPCDSIGNTMQFGAKTKCFKDIGVDLNKQRRG